ncbi:unnamed protein product, partial [Staurois parvus]
MISHRPCIHYIWSPTDPAFTISGLPQCKLLNTFSHQQLEQSCDFSRALVKACRSSFLYTLG